MKKNLLSISQLTASGNYMVFGLKDVKVYHNLNPARVSIIEAQKLESIYAMPTESAYVE